MYFEKYNKRNSCERAHVRTIAIECGPKIRFVLIPTNDAETTPENGQWKCSALGQFLTFDSVPTGRLAKISLEE